MICKICEAVIVSKGKTGREAIYCSDACRMVAYRRRKKERESTEEESRAMLQGDLFTDETKRVTVHRKRRSPLEIKDYQINQLQAEVSLQKQKNRDLESAHRDKVSEVFDEYRRQRTRLLSAENWKMRLSKENRSLRKELLTLKRVLNKNRKK